MTEALSDSCEFISAIQINLSIHQSIDPSIYSIIIIIIIIIII